MEAPSCALPNLEVLFTVKRACCWCWTTWLCLRRSRPSTWFRGSLRIASVFHAQSSALPAPWSTAVLESEAHCWHGKLADSSSTLTAVFIILYTLRLECKNYRLILNCTRANEMVKSTADFLAHLVEHRTCVWEVVGSRPDRTIIRGLNWGESAAFVSDLQVFSD